jgi:hypothetical protein
MHPAATMILDPEKTHAIIINTRCAVMRPHLHFTCLVDRYG